MSGSEQGRTRAQALSAAAAAGAAVGAGALAGSWAAPGPTPAQPSAALDERIFNFLLVLEGAQVAFYDAAERRLKAGGDVAEFIATVAPQEREHVAFLRERLGPNAKAQPRFDFGAVTTDSKRFRRAAAELEEATAAAWPGVGARAARDIAQRAHGLASARRAGRLRDRGHAARRRS
jgi:hypothetical protein